MIDFEIIELLERIDKLIRLEATGTPKEFSVKLGVSESSVYRIIKRLKNRDIPVYYDKTNNSYRYKIYGKLNFTFGFDTTESSTSEQEE